MSTPQTAPQLTTGAPSNNMKLFVVGFIALLVYVHFQTPAVAGPAGIIEILTKPQTAQATIKQDVKKAQKNAVKQGVVNPATRSDYGYLTLNPVWQQNLPVEAQPYVGVINAGAKACNVDPRLEFALIRYESDFNRFRAVDGISISPDGAVGLGQLMPATARGMGINPYDNAQNAKGTACALRGHLQNWHNNLTYALAAYNAGDAGIAQSGLAAAAAGYASNIETAYRRFGGIVH